ncbi:ECM33-like protein [Metarhizium acridum CQMa 102]|uniref:ECM33-like protein n=1 Tax=Metarhizium acridum (strain CQMa 102) TaxID=655827 RepID=E9DYB2_METAQ|nr:ECM33-like protein [Metarhizium acridum CQMa 102]EFY91447.1 ECM33-like protein [Metarhizium acridum CQMa 102]
MHSVKLFSAVLAVAGFASAATTCSQDVKVTQPTPVIDCDVVDANILVDSSVSGSLSIEGPEQVKGDLIINNATQLLGISSSSINAIGGTLRLQGLQLLSSFNMRSLKSVDNLELINLAQLSGMTLGTSGVTKAKSIKIQDTFISDLSGLNVATADNITIANNGRLASFTSKLENVTYTLSVVDNAGSMQINMSQLQSVGILDFRSIKSFDAPLLETANRISFQESPDLLSVSANNLTQIKDSLTLDNNKKLANISFTALEKISGDMTIRNNTALLKINKFPKLKTIGGAVLLAGSFDTVEIPELNDIKGAVTVTSTTDISDFCGFFDNLAKKNAIQGKESCTSNNAKANEGGKGGTSGGNKTDSAAMNLGVNHAVLGFAAVAGFAQLI